MDRNEIDAAIARLAELRDSKTPAEWKDMGEDPIWEQVNADLGWPVCAKTTLQPIEDFLKDPPGNGSFKKLLLRQGGYQGVNFHCRLLCDNPPEFYVFGNVHHRSTGSKGYSRFQTVALFRTPELRLPKFTVYEENLMHRFASLLGWQDIDFEEDPGFSKRFVLRGTDEESVRQWFDGDCREFFLERCSLGAANRYLGLGMLAEADRLAIFCEMLQTGSFRLTLHRATSPVAGPREIVEFVKSALEIYRLALEKSR
jgi:hypothetical protein